MSHGKLAFFFSLFLVVTLFGCGHDVCIAGMGKCSVYEKTPLKKGIGGTGNGAGAPTTSKYPVVGCSSWGRCWMVAGQSLPLVAVGGTGTGYVFKIKEGGSYPGQVSGSTFTCPTPGTSRVVVQDSSGPSYYPLSEVEITIVPAQ